MTVTADFGSLEFVPFTEPDVEVFTHIMKRAFDYDTQIHTEQAEGGPPGYDDGGFLRKYYLHEDSMSYKVSKDGRPAGAVCVWINANNVNYLGNIFVALEFQDKGLGKTIWDFIEHRYPDTIKWQTDTPAFSRRNHHFYVNKLGFRIVRIENPKSANDCSYFMEKDMECHR
jgi:hypothetical protein